MLREWFNGLINSEYFNTLKRTILPYLKELRNYHFSLFNPLFWVSLLILLFFLSRRWELKKSSSFCFLVAIVLLGTTLLENRIADTLAKSQIFDFTVLRMVSIFVISLILIYYVFIKGI